MAKRALGTTLAIGATTVGGLTSISGVEISADTIDVTTLVQAVIGSLLAGSKMAEKYQRTDI